MRVILTFALWVKTMCAQSSNACIVFIICEAVRMQIKFISFVYHNLQTRYCSSTFPLQPSVLASVGQSCYPSNR